MGSSESADIVAYRLVIHGRVQGVWFRGWTVETALSLGLDGWVRNRRDGSVEALVSGPAHQVQQMIDQCGHGPRHARVDHVDSTPAPPCPGAGFEQRPTV